MTSGNYFGGAGLAPFHDFEDKIPQEVKDKLAEIAAGLAGWQPDHRLSAVTDR
jgi:basic membrane protein A